MITRGTTPCTGLTFIKNSGASLEQCLQSCLFCAEHVLLDGGSTDGSLQLAAQYGCKVVPQDKKFLNSEGRIIDYAGITNQGIAQARFPWITITDSDEFLDGELIAEMQRIVERGVPGAYYVNRLYTLDGTVIRHASTYPNLQIRLWHGDTTTGFIKIVHERPALKPGVVPQILPGIQYVPLDPVPDMRRKFLRYLDLETRFAGGYGWWQWLRLAWNKVLRMKLRILRILWARIRHPADTHLPLSYEWLHIWYPAVIVYRTCPLVYRGLRQRSS